MRRARPGRAEIRHGCGMPGDRLYASTLAEIHPNPLIPWAQTPGPAVNTP
jgi:hypothetical protein